MAFIDQPIEVAGAPSKPDHEIGIERGGYAADLVERHEIEATSLDQADDVLRYASSSRKVLLAPAEAMPQGSKLRADPELHPHSIASGGSLRITYEAASW